MMAYVWLRHFQMMFRVQDTIEGRCNGDLCIRGRLESV